MGYLESSAAAVVRAFEVDGCGEALDALFEGLWAPTETRGETVRLARDVGALLGGDGHATEAGFCGALADSMESAPRDGALTAEWFATECLRLADWARPSPTRVAREYLDAKERLGVALSALGEVLADRARRRIAEDAREDARSERLARIGRIARKSVLAVGTLGVSLAFGDLLDDDL